MVLIPESYVWINKGLLKCKSKYSNVLCFETNDEKRFDQLLKHITSLYDDVYIYDRWNGLRKLYLDMKGDVKFEGVSSGIGDKFSLDKSDTGSSNIIDIREALRYVDKILKKEKNTILILKNLEEYKDQLTRSEDLIDAVRSWTTDSDIIFNNSVIILVASDISKLLDDYTLSLAILIRPDIASKEERKIMINDSAKEVGIKISEDTINVLVTITSGLNLHQLESTLLETYSIMKSREEKGSFNIEIIKDIKSDIIRRSDLIEVIEPGVDFNSIGGYNEIKTFIRQNVINVIKNEERAKKLVLRLPRGILLFGPPGTGKTHFAKALAKETNLPFINMKTENLFSKYLGESGQRFKNAIDIAEQMSPAIVFIDEIDRFGKRAGGDDSGASQETGRVFSQVLEWLGDQERKAIIVGTTNEPDHMDEAFLRTGRFDYKIPLLYPNKDARKDILEIHLGLKGSKNRPYMEDGISGILYHIAEKTKDFSGAEIEELVNRAKRNAFKNNRDHLKHEDLMYALESFIISGREDIKKRYNDLVSKYTDNIEFSRLLSKD